MSHPERSMTPARLKTHSNEVSSSKQAGGLPSGVCYGLCNSIQPMRG